MIAQFSDEKDIEKLFVDREREELTIINQDIGAQLQRIYKTDLNELLKLNTLKLEKCKIDYFEPYQLNPSLKHISLQQNRIKELDSIVLGIS